ncbi:MAG TPA: carbohydrate-binding domain-containing protein [Marinilabiliaceae bacterium]|nr:carbohydrate-binding domain-containing protein [Marinilabiliaceae bacterium]
MKNISRLFYFVTVVMISFSCSKEEANNIPKKEVDPKVSGYSVEEAMAENVKDHDEPGDADFSESDVVEITLKAASIAVEQGKGADVSDNVVTINSAGTYRLSGKINDGRVIVNVSKDELVRIIMNNADITCLNGAPMFIAACKKTIIILADGTENYLADHSSYIFDLPEEKEPNAALFSKDDMTICGTGKLTVTGKFNDAIGGKDGLVIKDAHLSLFAVDDGIQVKDYVVIKGDAVLDIRALDDGIKSFHETDPARGYTYIQSGVLNIIAGGDGIQAETQILVSNGTFDIVAGTGSDFNNVDNLSLKGLKSVTGVIIDDGNFVIDAADDAINSDGIISINGGDFTLSSGDDALHADVALGISGGNINILTCTGGLEGNIITIKGGIMNVVATVDGINILDEKESDSQQSTRKLKSGIEGEKSHLYIHGGHLYITALDDGIDVNGTFEMTGGEVVVNGKVGGDKAFEINGDMIISGGVLIATQEAVMEPLPLELSKQHSLMVGFSAVHSAGTLFHIQKKSGDELLTFSPSQKYQSVFISTPSFVEDEAYKIFYGGFSTGSMSHGIYKDGIYSPGDFFSEFTASKVVTHIQ